MPSTSHICLSSGQSMPPTTKQADGRTKVSQIPFLEYLEYRFFANAIFDRFQEGDIATAAKVAHIMEISWDRESDRFNNQTKDIWTRLDTVQDEFIQPIKGGYLSENPHPPDRVQVENAYKRYLIALAREANISDAEAAKLANEK